MLRALAALDDRSLWRALEAAGVPRTVLELEVGAISCRRTSAEAQRCGSTGASPTLARRVWIVRRRAVRR